MNPTEEAGVAETSKALTKFGPSEAQEIGLPSPAALNFMFSTANMLYSSALVTKDMGLSKDQVARLQQFGVTGADLEERDRKAVVSNMMGKMLVGRELGMDPIASLQDVDIVKSKIFIRYPQLHRLIEEKGWDLEEIERSNTRAAIKLTHKTKKPRTFEFTIEDAKMAGLAKRGGYNNDSPSQYELRPRVMLWSRVISEAYRATGGKGSIYTPEEKQEILREEIQAAIAAPEPEHDPYAVQMPAKQASSAPSDAGDKGGGARESASPNPHPSNSAAPTLDKTANDAQAGVATPAGADTGNRASGSPGGTKDAAVTAAPLQTGPGEGEAAVKSSPPDNVQEMPKAKANGGPSLADIEKMLPAKTRKKTIDEFLRGYFRKADMKAIIADPGFPDAMRWLATNATGDLKTRLESDPHGVGVMCSTGWKKVKEYAWSDETRGYMETLAMRLYPGIGGGGLPEILTLVKADQMPAEELKAFLWVLERVKDEVAVTFHRRAPCMALHVEEWNGLNTTQIADAIEALPEPSEEQQGSLLTEGA